jgi:ADP-heptose:LPS heptosyltransferase
VAVSGPVPAGRMPRLVMLRALGLGDLLTAVPAIRAAADAHPGYRRILAAPAALAPLARLSGAIDEVVSVGPLEALPDVLQNAEVAVNLHGRGPHSHRLLRSLAPGRLIAFANRENGVRGPAWRSDEHERARWCRLLCECGIPADPGRLHLSAPAAGRTDRYVVIHPGAASPARRWPAERFAAVARALRGRGDRVLVTGSSSERPLASRVARLAGLPDDDVVAGATDLMGLARLVGGAREVVSGDTGVAHLAAALRAPSVALFGPTDPALWGPPAGGGRHRVLWAGSTGDPHGERPDPGLLSITVRDVLRVLGVDDPARPAIHHRRNRWRSPRPNPSHAC